MHERYHSRVSIEKLAVSVVEACASAREIVSKMIEFKFSKITSWFGAWGACSLAVGVPGSARFGLALAALEASLRSLTFCGGLERLP
jgi:hypothetical protein